MFQTTNQMTYFNGLMNDIMNYTCSWFINDILTIWHINVMLGTHWISNIIMNDTMITLIIKYLWMFEHDILNDIDKPTGNDTDYMLMVIDTDV